MNLNTQSFDVIEGGGATSASGFEAAGVTCGLKRSGKADLALLFSAAPCNAAGTFTSNLFPAAPVILCRERIEGGAGIRAIVVNSGVANACTGELGMKYARETAKLAADALGIDETQALSCSTGRIGVQLPMDKIAAGIKAAAAAKKPDGGHEAALAIMTTDTRPKEACATVTIGGKKVTVGGMSKGSGMIEPNMATMLGFLTTDAAVSPRMLKRALQLAVGRSFNRLVVDGDESTNDSLFILASGKAGNREIDAPGKDFDAFRAALEAVCVSLARQMATDGEGATKFVTVTVKGAKTERDAERAARAVAKSPLAKTSWFGKDPNWGRVLAAVGYSGAEVVDMKSEVFYDGVWAFRFGKVADEKQLARLAKVMKKDAFSVVVDLHLGTAESTIYTCDLSLDYVHINADYTT